MYRQATLERHITRVERQTNPNALILHTSVPRLVPGNYLRNGGIIPRQEPNIWSGISNQERAAILSLEYCNDSSAIVSFMLRELLGDFCHKIQHFEIQVKSPPPLTATWRDPSEIQTPSSQSPSRFHEVLLLAPKRADMGAFVLDLTGAQYGWHKPLLRLPAFEAERCAAPIALEDLTDGVEWYAARREEKFDALAMARMIWAGEMVEGLNHAIRDDVLGIKMTARQIGGLGVDVLEVMKEDFLGKMEGRIADVVTRVDGRFAAIYDRAERVVAGLGGAEIQRRRREYGEALQDAGLQRQMVPRKRW